MMGCAALHPSYVVGGKIEVADDGWSEAQPIDHEFRTQHNGAMDLTMLGGFIASPYH